MSETGIRRYRAIVEYDGTEFHGFQRQVRERTVQGELERALHTVCGAEHRVLGAGRTDAGVHARGQVIAFDAVWRHGPKVLERALNARAPRDVAIRCLEPVDNGFHPRYSAESRTYFYNLYQSQTHIPVLDRHFSWEPHELDLIAMDQAAHMLIGVHDMATFGQPTQGDVTVRHVMQSCWRQIEGAPYLGRAQGYQFIVEANGFLRGMVRRIVGCLLAVGEGRQSVQAFGEVMAASDIAQAEPPAAACGLVLWRVKYPDDYPDGQRGASQ